MEVYVFGSAADGRLTADSDSCGDAELAGGGLGWLRGLLGLRGEGVVVSLELHLLSPGGLGRLEGVRGGGLGREGVHISHVRESS